MEQATEQDSPALRFLRGAMWRNFQARYREVNDLHKQMLRVSRAVDAMPAGAARDEALDHLYRGQSNDCYWHGLFGGMYIVHMRMATLAELIAAEDIALGDSAMAGVADFDLDGIDEVALGTTGQTVLVDLAEGARHRLVGPARVTRRPGLGHAPPARGLPRQAARGRSRRGASGAGNDAQPARAATGQGGRAGGAARLRRP